MLAGLLLACVVLVVAVGWGSGGERGVRCVVACIGDVCVRLPCTGRMSGGSSRKCIDCLAKLVFLDLFLLSLYL